MVERRTNYKASRSFRKAEEALVLYLPIGGGAEGRGAALAKKDSVGWMVEDNSSNLRTFEPMNLFITFGEPQNPQKLLKPVSVGQLLTNNQ